MRRAGRSSAVVATCLAATFLSGARREAQWAVPSRGYVAVDSLPIFVLAPPDSSTRKLRELAAAVFEQRDSLLPIGTIESVGARKVLEHDTFVAELFNSGGFWIADRRQLWNPNLRPLVPNADSVRSLVPDLASVFELPGGRGQDVDCEWFVDSTVAVQLQGVAPGHRTTPWLVDRHATCRGRVQLPGRGTIPIVGGGNQLRVYFGDSGRVIAASGVWRTPTGSFSAPLVSRAETDSIFRSLIGTATILPAEPPTLAYYSAPSADRQQRLYPVWVYRAVIHAAGRHADVRDIFVPATRYHEEPAGAGTSFAPQRAAGLHGLVRPPYLAGTEFVQNGLLEAEANVAGFASTLEQGNWRIEFAGKDGKAHLDDWITNDDRRVDSVSFVFYTGHAADFGWSLQAGNVWLKNTDVGAAADAAHDFWGDRHLKWLVIAACGPLQDVSVDTGGDVFARWTGAFDGLRLLMGYATRSYDTPSEGARLAGYALEGEPLVDAWLRTASETQSRQPDGQPVWAGVLYPVFASGDARNDHLSDAGMAATGPPTGFIAMWTSI
jgi:hypothetical protein